MPSNCRTCGNPTNKLHGYCAPCKKRMDQERYQQKKTAIQAQNKAWYEANRDKRRASIRAYAKAHPEVMYKGIKQWEANHPERVRLSRKASEQVRTALRRKILTKPDRCENCNQLKRVEGAHQDYTKPLEVRWLCRSCHVQWDHEQPKTK